MENASRTPRPVPEDVFASTSRLLDFQKSDFDRIDRVTGTSVGARWLDFTAVRASGGTTHGRIEP